VPAAVTVEFEGGATRRGRVTGSDAATGAGFAVSLDDVTDATLAELSAA
jgi:hypothetical protein